MKAEKKEIVYRPIGTTAEDDLRKLRNDITKAEEVLDIKRTDLANYVRGIADKHGVDVLISGEKYKICVRGTLYFLKKVK